MTDAKKQENINLTLRKCLVQFEQKLLIFHLKNMIAPFTGTALGRADPNAVLCKTCSVLCVLEQPRVYL
jgi:hypothetical protein